jgi:hypothetical protein
MAVYDSSEIGHHRLPGQLVAAERRARGIDLHAEQLAAKRRRHRGDLDRLFAGARRAPLCGRPTHRALADIQCEIDCLPAAGLAVDIRAVGVHAVVRKIGELENGVVRGIGDHLRPGDDRCAAVGRRLGGDARRREQRGGKTAESGENGIAHGGHLSCLMQARYGLCQANRTAV